MTGLADFFSAISTDYWMAFTLKMVLADLAIGLVVLIGHRWYKRAERKMADLHNKASIEPR
jgi:hypothetical protein